MVEKAIYERFEQPVPEEYELQDLINMDDLRKLLDDFYKIVPFPTAVLNLKGEILLESHWEPICTQFHRVHPETAALCTESDTHFNTELPLGGERHVMYRCGNGLYDAAFPIIIEGRHLGNLYIGQFLLEPPDEGFFRKQAQRYGFEEEAYLEALKSVPIMSERDLKNRLDYLCGFAEFLGNIGLKEFQRDRAVKALRQSESFIRAVMDHLSIGVAVNSLEPSLDIRYMNDNFPRFYRTTREALADPDAFWNAVYQDPVYREEIKKRVLDDCADGDPARMHWESVPITREGEETTFISARNIPVPDRQLMISTVWDVTRYKRAEEALRLNEEQFRMLYNNAPAMMHSIDPEGRLMTVSDYWLKKLGYDRDEVIGKKSTDFLTEKSRHDALKVYFPKFFKEGWIQDVPYQFLKRDGDIIDTLLSAVCEKDHLGNIVRSLAVFIDVTEHKKLESRLLHAEKMESIGVLAGGVAHDFNNILGIILGNAELALDDVPEWNPATGFLKEIRSSSLRAKDVVQELLRFSRKSEAQRKPLELCQLVKESMKMLRISIPTSIDFSLNIPESLNYIHADPTQMNQILMNLASNAADAMDEKGGVLEISIQYLTLHNRNEEMGLEPGDYVKLSVKDTGDGIEAENLNRIYDPYFTTKDVGKGTGMGLAVVYGIVKRHGSSIRIDTRVGEGTTFELFFPAIDMEPEPLKKTEHRFSGGTETILFVDDEDAMVELNEQRLERLGYQVIGKTDPSEALAFFRANPGKIDLVITDMTMPHMTGDKLTKAILEIRPDTPIILCTGYSEKISKERARNLGIRKYIEKPIEMADLARSVREVLDGTTPTGS